MYEQSTRFHIERNGRESQYEVTLVRFAMMALQL
jgi:hypothetical protein